MSSSEGKQFAKQVQKEFSVAGIISRGKVKAGRNAVINTTGGREVLGIAAVDFEAGNNAIHNVAPGHDKTQLPLSALIARNELVHGEKQFNILPSIPPNK